MLSLLKLRCDAIISVFVVICIESLEQSICIGLFVGVRGFELTEEHHMFHDSMRDQSEIAMSIRFGLKRPLHGAL